MQRTRKYLILAILSCGTIVSSCSVNASSPPTEKKELPWKDQVAQLDQEIETKTNQMNLFKAKAARAQNQGDRLQFNSRDVTEARRYWQIADYYNAQADLLAMEISQLKTQKSAILGRNQKPPVQAPLNDTQSP